MTDKMDALGQAYLEDCLLLEKARSEAQAFLVRVRKLLLERLKQRPCERELAGMVLEGKDDGNGTATAYCTMRRQVRLDSTSSSTKTLKVGSNPFSVHYRDAMSPGWTGTTTTDAVIQVDSTSTFWKAFKAASLDEEARRLLETDSFGSLHGLELYTPRCLSIPIPLDVDSATRSAREAEETMRDVCEQLLDWFELLLAAREPVSDT